MARRTVSFLQVADPDWKGWFFNLTAVGIVRRVMTEVKECSTEHEG